MVTPFGPTPDWIRNYLFGIANPDSLQPREGGDLTEVKGKEFARCRISGRTLTIPVEGGSGTLKRRGSNPVLSEHGKWRREHLGAWQAAYGRTPYYMHLMPEIEAVYERSEGMTLEDFNSALLQVILGWIDPSVAGKRDLFEEVRSEMLEGVNEELSIFDALFRLGRRTSFII